MRALSIRQPWAELILRGVKTVEYRSRPTRVVGERFWLYAAKKEWPVVSGQWPVKTGVWSRDLAGAGGGPPAWMWEMAEQLILAETPDARLPRGVIVGSAVIERVVASGWEKVASGQWLVASEEEAAGRSSLTTNHSPLTTTYEWHLSGVERAAVLRKPERQPQPVWFRPF